MPIALHLRLSSSIHCLSSFYASIMIHPTIAPNIRVFSFSIEPLRCFEEKECIAGEGKDGPVKWRSEPKSDWRTAVSTFRLGSWNCSLLLLMNRLRPVSPIQPSRGVAAGSRGGCSCQPTPLPISAVEAINGRPLTPCHRTNASNPLKE